MSARDKYHEIVKGALLNEYWEVTHDPYIIGLQGLIIRLIWVRKKL